MNGRFDDCGEIVTVSDVKYGKNLPAVFYKCLHEEIVYVIFQVCIVASSSVTQQ